MEKIHLGVEIPKTLESKIRIRAANLGMSKSEFLRKLLEAYFSELDKGKDFRVFKDVSNTVS